VQSTPKLFTEELRRPSVTARLTRWACRCVSLPLTVLIGAHESQGRSRPSLQARKLCAQSFPTRDSSVSAPRRLVDLSKLAQLTRQSLCCACIQRVSRDTPTHRRLRQPWQGWAGADRCSARAARRDKITSLSTKTARTTIPCATIGSACGGDGWSVLPTGNRVTEYSWYSSSSRARRRRAPRSLRTGKTARFRHTHNPDPRVRGLGALLGGTLAGTARRLLAPQHMLAVDIEL